MADFREFLEYVQKLNENELSPDIAVQPDNTAAEFDTSIFATSLRTSSALTVSGFDPSIFQTSTLSYATLTTSYVGGLQGNSDIELYLDSLAPAQKQNERTPKIDYAIPYSSGHSISLFKDKAPADPPSLVIDNVNNYSIDPESEIGISDIVSNPEFQEGETIILKEGVYRGPFNLDRSCGIVADGKVVIEGSVQSIIIDNGAEVAIEGVTFTKGEVLIKNGKLQATNCTSSTTFSIKNDSAASFKDVKFSQTETPCLVVVDTASVACVNCEFTGRGVSFDGSSISMLNCRIENVEGTGILVKSGTGRFDDCHFGGCSGDVLVGSHSCDLVLTRCQMENAANGYLVNARAGAIIKLRNCVLDGECKAAIVAANLASVACDEMVIKNAVVVTRDALAKMKKCELQKVLVSSGKLNMTDCKVQGTGIACVGKSDVRIEGTTFSECNKNGLELLDNTTSTIVKCVFKQCRRAGVLFSSVSSIVRDCVFEANKVSGAQISGNGTNASFRDCSFTESALAGVTILDGANPAFNKCQFRLNSKFGALISESFAAFTGCGFGSNKGIGIEVEAGGHPILYQCLFDENESFAAQIRGQDTIAEFSECRFQKNEHTSSVIGFDNAVFRFTNCTFSESGEYHAEIREGAIANFDQCDLSESQRGIGIFVHCDGHVVIEKCTLKQERRTAVYAGEKGQVTIKDTEITGSENCGLLFGNESTGDVRGSTIASNGECGIEIEGGKVHIEGCTIKNHMYFGIYSKTGADVSEDSNVFSGNEKGDHN